MAKRRLILRNAVMTDAAALAEVERQSWPVDLAATVSQYRDRIQAFPEGQWVAEQGGMIVGLSSAQRITQQFFDTNSHGYDCVTDCGRFTHSHQSDGEIYQLIGVGVLPQYQGQQLGRRLVDRQVEFACSLSNVARIVGFTRPVLYHRYQGVSIEDYVSRRKADGSLTDPVLAFHLDAGAKLVAIHPRFRIKDQAACGFGILIEYPKSIQVESLSQ